MAKGIHFTKCQIIYTVNLNAFRRNSLLCLSWQSMHVW